MVFLAFYLDLVKQLRKIVFFLEGGGCLCLPFCSMYATGLETHGKHGDYKLFFVFFLSYSFFKAVFCQNCSQQCVWIMETSVFLQEKQTPICLHLMRQRWCLKTWPK